jgi:hypothetical protein
VPIVKFLRSTSTILNTNQDSVLHFLDAYGGTQERLIDIFQSCSSILMPLYGLMLQLIAAAHERWMDRENGCADDITALVIRFKFEAGSTTRRDGSHEHDQ